jgi:hypothetical protein
VRKLLLAGALILGTIIGATVPQEAEAAGRCCVYCQDTHACGMCVWLECGSCGTGNCNIL